MAYVKTTRFFTLIEMLVVIAIIGIIAAMLIPSLKASLEIARQISCLNNFKQIGMGIHSFADDHSDHFVGHGYKLKYTAPTNTWASGGSVLWSSIINGVVFPGEYVNVKDRALPEGMYGCTNITAPCRNRTLGMPSILTTGGPEIPQAQWPPHVEPFGGSTDSQYFLGQNRIKFKYPARNFMLIDTECQTFDTYARGRFSYNNMLPRISPISGVPYFGADVGGVALRHNGNAASALYIDMHATSMTFIPDNWDDAIGYMD